MPLSSEGKMQKRMKLNGKNWGGRRRGAGRKRMKSKGVAHRTRENVNHRTPMHINFKYRTHVRNKERLKLLKRSIQNARSHGLKILHYSFQRNHVHLIIEAINNETLTRGMRSLTITFAKGVNMGRIQVERYHLHVLRSLRETRNAMMYVLFNEQKHERGICSTVSGYSSLLSHPRAMELIRDFAKRKKKVIVVERGEAWRGDPARSFLAMKATLLPDVGRHDTRSSLHLS
jgi:hypothetical protein